MMNLSWSTFQKLSLKVYSKNSISDNMCYKQVGSHQQYLSLYLLVAEDSTSLLLKMEA